MSRSPAHYPSSLCGRLTVCLHRGTHPVARLIRWFTHSPYSHVSLLLPDGRHAEAREFEGVVVHDCFCPKTWEQVDFFVLDGGLSESPALAQAISTFVTETVGDPYDYLTVLSFLIGARRTRPSPTRWFCSEWVFEGLARGGVRLVRSETPWRLSPGDVSLSTHLVLVPESAPTSFSPS